MPSDIPQDMLMDVRIRERNIRKGLTSDKDAQKYHANLPDLGDKAVVMEAKLEHASQDAEARAAGLSAARNDEEEELD